MEKQPLISVILPTYNDQNVLSQTIESVLRQTYRHWELIVVDDGSTDETLKQIQQYQDPRIQAVHLSANRHICYALNEGLRRAKGEYIARIDSGDTFMEEKLQVQLDYMQEHPACGACFSWTNLINEKGENVNEKFPGIYQLMSSQKNRTQAQWMEYFIGYGNCICHPSAFIRKTVLDQVGWYDLAYVQGQDYDLWMRIVLQYPIHIVERCLVNCLFSTDKKGKISVNNEANNTRFYNERVCMVEKMFAQISDKKWVEFFQKHFRKKDASGKIELECEKAFYLLDCMEENYHYPYLMAQGIHKLYQLLQEEESRTVLEETYHFTLHDYYQLMTSHQYYDYIIRSNIHQLQEQIGQLEEKGAQKEEEIRSLKEFIEKEGKDIAALQEAVFRRNTRIVQMQHAKGARMLQSIQNVKDCLLKHEGYRPVLYLLCHNYGNLGDHLIVSRMHDFLQHYFPKHSVVEIPVRYYDAQKSELVAKVNPEDILLIQGGGSISYKYFAFGERYYWDLMQSFPHNQILVFPQSLFFDQTPQEQEQLHKSGAVFSAHPYLTLCLREKNSIRIAEGIYQCKKLLVPDIALFGSAYKSDKPRENMGLFLMREDCEINLSKEEKEQVYREGKMRASEWIQADTQLDYFLDGDQREGEIAKLVEKLLRAKFVITDRIHGMIFAALTQTPCVAIDNSYGKVSGTYNAWLQDLPYIKMAGAAQEVGTLLDEVLKVDRPVYRNQHLMPYYDRLAKEFHIS